MSSGTWKDKTAMVERVFRQVDYKHPRPDAKLCTLNMAKRMEAGTSFDAVCAIIRPNHVLQYVLSETAVHYEKQLEALRRHEKLGFIEEIDPADKGKIFIPPHEPTELEKKLMAAEARIKELEEAGKSSKKTVKSE